MINTKLIYNIAFFSIIFMYFQILPINIETQPLLIVVLLPLFLLIKLKNNFKFNSEDKLLLIYIIIIFLYFIFSLINGQGDSFEYLLRFILGPITYLFLLKNVGLLNIKTLKIMTMILFSVAVINVMHIPVLYSFLSSVMNAFFNRYSLNYAGVRGMCILTPEPSYFVYFAMLLLFSFDFVEYRTKEPEHTSYKLLIYFMCILTKSALVYAFLCMYMFFKYIYSSKERKIKHILKNILIGCIVLTFVFVSIKLLNINLANNRFFQIFNSITSKNISEILFFSDSSSGFRFLINYIYILSIFSRPFGYGFGGMERNWSIVAKKFNINYHKNGMFKYSYNEYSLLHAQAYIPNVIGAIGIFSFILIYFVYKNNRLEDTSLKYSLIITLTLFLFILQSNMFNPVFWVLLGYCKYSNSIEKEKII